MVTDALGLELRRPPSDSACRYVFQQVDVAALCAAIRDWTMAQIPGGADHLDQLICDGKTLRGSIEPTAGPLLGIHCPGDAVLGRVWRGVLLLSQACYATGENHEWAVLRQLLVQLDLESVLIQADALHTQKVFGSSRSRGPTSS
jgi:hypothetical protein